MDQRTQRLIHGIGLLYHWLSTYRTTDPRLIEFLRHEADGGFFAADPEIFIAAIDQLFAEQVPVSEAAAAALRRTRDYLDSLRGAVLIESSIIETAPGDLLAPFAGTYFDVGRELGAVLDELSKVASAEAEPPREDGHRSSVVFRFG